MKLPTKPRKDPLTVNPKVTLIFGAPKVGKTEALTQDIHGEKILIIDTEEGTRTRKDVLSVMASSVKDLIDIYKALKEEADSGKRRKYVAIDTIDKVVDWIDKAICAKYGVDNLGDIPHGKGWSMRKEKLIELIEKFKSVSEHLIIVGHEKRTTIGDETNVEIDIKHINLSGQLKITVSSDADAIGKVFREDNKLMISFQGAEDQVEAGSRIEHLANKVMPFEWNKIFKK